MGLEGSGFTSWIPFAAGDHILDPFCCRGPHPGSLLLQGTTSWHNKDIVEILTNTLNLKALADPKGCGSHLYLPIPPELTPYTSHEATLSRRVELHVYS